MGAAKAIFQEVSSEADNEKLITKVELHYPFLTCKTELTHKFLLLKTNHVEGKKLFATFVEGVELSKATQSIVSFEIESEKYFLKTSVSPNDKFLVVDLGQPIYQVQRRENFRVNIPQSFKAMVSLTSAANAKNKSENIPLNDLSAGGCGFDFDSKGNGWIQSGTRTQIFLSIGQHEPLKLPAEVRSVRKVGDKGRMRAGIHFQSLAVRDQEKLASLVTEIHRYIFAKLK